MQKETHNISTNVILFDGFSNLCLANAIEPLRAANDILGRSYYNWKIETLTGKRARSSSGLSIMPDGPVDVAANADRLFLISSYGYDAVFNQSLGKVMRAYLYNQKEIYGLDTGAWLMAEAGLLNGKRATIHWDVLSRFEEKFLSVQAENRPFVRDDLLVTCGGAMSTFDLILQMIVEDCGAGVGFDVENLFKRVPSLQYQSEADELTDIGVTRKAMVIMRANLEKPLRLKLIAASLDVHPKAMERAFKKEFGAPAGQLYKRLRLNSVRDLVENTNANFADIAVRSGYQSASAMTRAFVAEFDYTPSELRKNSK